MPRGSAHTRTMTEETRPDSVDSLDDAYWAAVLESVEQEWGGWSSRVGNLTSGQGAEKKEGQSSIDWILVELMRHEERVFDCCVMAYNRGGLLVECETVRGFVPASHLVDCPPCHTEEERVALLKGYLGKRLQLKIIESDARRERIVMSERAGLTAPGIRARLFYQMQPGQVLLGCVTNITEFGIFLDLGGLEGLAHISELSWGRVSHPKIIAALGDRVDAVVLQVDPRRGRVSLSLKRLKDNPWLRAEERFPIGKTIEAVVSEIVPYGCFARLEEGIEGLIHISEMHLPEGQSADELLTQGQIVNVEVLSLDATRQRLGLRLRNEESKPS
ncbi:MAG: 30S ribosomal protein S1 [Anaerolineae bacterium]|nr:MAG: 30S ribosomal protein S1 [Anaerolineae bacterium]